jgi:hypothetical protein
MKKLEIMMKASALKIIKEKYVTKKIVRNYANTFIGMDIAGSVDWNKIMADTIETITENLDLASQVILQPLNTFTVLVKADVDVVKAIADLDWYYDTTRVRIYAKEENKEQTSAYLKSVWKNQTIEERRLLKIAEGFQVTLKQLIYRASK